MYYDHSSLVSVEFEQNQTSGLTKLSKSNENDKKLLFLNKCTNITVILHKSEYKIALFADLLFFQFSIFANKCKIFLFNLGEILLKYCFT